jgi:hypothetical protein
LQKSKRPTAAPGKIHSWKGTEAPIELRAKSLILQVYDLLAELFVSTGEENQTILRKV